MLPYRDSDEERQRRADDAQFENYLRELRARRRLPAFAMRASAFLYQNLGCFQILAYVLLVVSAVLWRMLTR